MRDPDTRVQKLGSLLSDDSVHKNLQDQRKNRLSQPQSPAMAIQKRGSLLSDDSIFVNVQDPKKSRLAPPQSPVNQAVSVAFQNVLAKLDDVKDQLAKEHSSEMARLHRENFSLRMTLRDLSRRRANEEADTNGSYDSPTLYASHSTHGSSVVPNSPTAKQSRYDDLLVQQERSLKTQIAQGKIEDGERAIRTGDRTMRQQPQKRISLTSSQCSEFEVGGVGSEIALHQDDIILEERVHSAKLPDNETENFVDSYLKPGLKKRSSISSTRSDSGKFVTVFSHREADAIYESYEDLQVEDEMPMRRVPSMPLQISRCNSILTDPDDTTILGDSLPSHLFERNSSPNAILHFWMKDCWANHTDLASITCRQILELTGAVLSSVGGSETPMCYSMSNPKWNTELSRGYARRFVMHPFSRKRFIWAALGLAFLLHDFVTIPIQVCFDSGRQSAVQHVLLWCALLFWTLDIPFNFLTAVFHQGALVWDPRNIARLYMRSWLLTDVFLVTVEWAVIIFESVADKASAVTMMRGVRWLRMFRIMRLLKLVRLTRLKPILFELIHHSSEDFKVFLRLLSCTLGFCALFHLYSCFWYLIGSSLDNGWVKTFGFTTGDDTTYRYVLSLQYVFSRAQGARDRINIRTTLEVFLDILWLFYCFIFAAFYIAMATHAVGCWANSDSAQLKKLAGNFIQRHKISRRAETRTRNFLSACRIQGMGEMLSDERRFLKMLPVPLQEDLLCEARAPIISATSFFRDLNDVNPRVMRTVCYQAISEILAVEEEIVFAPGDTCRSATFVVEGELLYRCRNIPHKIQKTQCLSEATLWTHWEHNGTLKAVYDTLLLDLDAERFFEGIVPHKLACAHAVKYARVFVQRLNHIISSDLTCFDDLDLESLDDNSDALGNTERHLMFLSHFKAEAGTEATLMRDALEQILSNDPAFQVDCTSPVFVDSEDLVDLARLKEHVENSEALVLLLTPGLLTRPWCLLEIMTAYRSEKRIVPVEVQRPGFTYQYPDEDYFRRFEEGTLLSEVDKKMLLENGCSLPEVTQSVRHVFQKIALPFSPHKSWNIRQAELMDLLKRCGVGSGNGHSGKNDLRRMSVMTSDTRRTLGRSPQQACD